MQLRTNKLPCLLSWWIISYQFRWIFILQIFRGKWVCTFDGIKDRYVSNKIYAILFRSIKFRFWSLGDKFILLLSILDILPTSTLSYIRELFSVIRYIFIYSMFPVFICIWPDVLVTTNALENYFTVYLINLSYGSANNLIQWLIGNPSYNV